MTGRLILLKYCSITIAIVLFVPTIVGLIFQLFLDDKTSVVTFYSNVLEDIGDNITFVLIQTLALILFIMFLGGLAERLIVQYNRPRFLIGGIALLILWLLLFVSSTITAAIENTGPFRLLGFWSSIIAWLRYGLPLYLIFGILHGLTMGYVVGNEIRNRNKKFKRTTYQQHL